MPDFLIPKGKTFVKTEDGEALSVRPLLSTSIMLTNGERVEVKRAFTASPIAASTADGAFIPAPPSALFYNVVLGLKIMCDAATLVTLKSKPAGDVGVGIDSPWPCAANGGFHEPLSSSIIAKGVPGEAITLGTGSGGNTYARAWYAVVPINVDIL